VCVCVSLKGTSWDNYKWCSGNNRLNYFRKKESDKPSSKWTLTLKLWRKIIMKGHARLFKNNSISLFLIFILDQRIHHFYSIYHLFLSSHTLSYLFSPHFLLTTKYRSGRTQAWVDFSNELTNYKICPS